jgi:hypothetical protein
MKQKNKNIVTVPVQIQSNESQNILENIEPEGQEVMESVPIPSRKRQLTSNAYTPIHPKYRQIAEAGYKRDTEQANLPDYQEKKFVRRGERLRSKPKRFDDWGL